MTPLHIAARKGHEDVVKFLLNDGALKGDLELRGLGLTPLDWAVRNGHDKVAEVLLDHKADVESRGLRITALNWAGWEGRTDFVENLVLCRKASIDARTEPDATKYCLELSNKSRSFARKTLAQIAFVIESRACRTAKEDADKRRMENQAAYTLRSWIAFAHLIVVTSLLFIVLGYYWTTITDVLNLAGWNGVWWLVVWLIFSACWLMVALTAFLNFLFAASVIIVLTVAAWAGFTSGWALIATATLLREGEEHVVILFLVREVQSFTAEVWAGRIIFALANWYNVSLVKWVCLATAFTYYSSFAVIRAARSIILSSNLLVNLGVYLCWAGCYKALLRTLRKQEEKNWLGVAAIISSMAMSVATILIRSIPTTMRSVTILQVCRVAAYFTTLGCIAAWILAEGIMCIRRRKRRIGTLQRIGYGQTTLHLASSSGHFEVVRFLLEQGAKIDASDGEMRTALHCAAMNGHDKVVSLLQEKRANLKAEDSMGKTPAQLAD